MTTAIYARISKDTEGKGLGVQRQVDDCRRVSSAPPMVFVDNDTSAFSGRRRPQYEAMMEAVEDGQVTEVVAWAPDRLHRSPTELERFIDAVERHGVTVRTVQAGMWDLSTPAGRMTARTLGAVARYESEHKSARLQRKARQLAEQGKRSGAVPYGWRSATEESTVRLIVEGLLAGDTLRSLARHLNGNAVPAPRGGEWTPQQVRAIALRWSNAGVRTHKGEIVADAEWPAIVSQEKQQQVVRLLNNPARRSSTSTMRKHLLSGVLRCGVCGKSMRFKQKRPKQADAYTCPDFHTSIQAELTERMVLDIVQARLQLPDATGLGGPTEDRYRREQDRLTVARQRLDTLAEDYALGILDRRQVDVAGRTLRGEIADIEATLAEYDKRANALAHAGVDVHQLPPERQRALIVALMDLEVAAIGQHGPQFDPNRIIVRWKTQ